MGYELKIIEAAKTMNKNLKKKANPLNLRRKIIAASVSTIPAGAPMDLGARPAISESIKREVRQRCGFGCVVCGCPLYDYEHMEEWAKVKRHQAEEITLLCSLHHREKTNGLLPISLMKKRNANPVNLIKGTTRSHALHIYGGETVLGMGDTYFFYDHDSSVRGACVLSISNQPILGFTFEDDNLLLNFVLYDETDRPILKILDNELVFSTQPWDITFTGHRIEIRGASRKILLVLNVDVNQGLVAIERAELRYDGYEVRIDETGVNMPGSFNGISNCRLKGSGWLINVGGIANMGAGMHYVGKRTYGPSKE